MDYYQSDKEKTRPKYIKIVKEIREMIEKDGLQSGDRLPSERDLSARLKAGRSSVREALRSLELIGIIETKRGEGTFLKNVTENQLVHVLGTFLLQMNQSKQDLLQTKMLIEEEAIRYFCQQKKENSTIHLKEVVSKEESASTIEAYYVFFEPLIKNTGNFLLYRIWEIIHEYTLPIYGERKIELDLPVLYKALHNGQEKAALEIYKKSLAALLQ